MKKEKRVMKGFITFFHHACSTTLNALTVTQKWKQASRHVIPNLHRDWVIACFGSRIKTFPKVEIFWTVYRFLILCCWTYDLYLFSLINVGSDVRTVQLNLGLGFLPRFLSDFFPYCFLPGLRSFEYSWTSPQRPLWRQKKVGPLKRGGRCREV